MLELTKNEIKNYLKQEGNIITVTKDGNSIAISKINLYAALGYIGLEKAESVRFPTETADPCPCIPGCHLYPECAG